MRPPARLWAPICLMLIGACNSSPEPSPTPQRGARLSIQLDERRVMVGEIVERLEGEDYVYLRLALVYERPSRGGPPGPTPMRWVAIEGRAPALGERIEVRSLAQRTRVWDPSIERDFEILDYVALLDPS